MTAPEVFQCRCVALPPDTKRWCPEGETAISKCASGTTCCRITYNHFIFRWL